MSSLLEDPITNALCVLLSLPPRCLQDAGESLTFDDTAAHSEPTPLQRTPNMATPRMMGTVAPQTGAAFSPFAEVSQRCPH